LNRTPVDFIRDLVVTLLLWVYFTLGFILFFLPRYLWAQVFNADREQAFQRLNSRFYRGFFFILRRLARGLEIRVDARVTQLHGAVVVGNHRSYLDPLMFITLFPRQKTIVKSAFFRTPIFGWFITRAGYLPDSAAGPAGALMIRHMETLGDFFNGGGVLFVFPEGTRRVGRGAVDLHGGAFKIAARFKVPLAVVRIQNTEQIFHPGRFLFRTGVPVTIAVELAGVLNRDEGGAGSKAEALRVAAMALLSKGGDSA
jgi:1-acyl-sn-glycerol-3-phosphate acyltransferase